MGEQRGRGDTGHDSRTSLLNTRRMAAKRAWSSTSRPRHSLERTVSFAIMRGTSVSCRIACKAVAMQRRTLSNRPEQRTKVHLEQRDFAPSDFCQRWTAGSDSSCAAFPCIIGLERRAQAAVASSFDLGDSGRGYMRPRAPILSGPPVYGKKLDGRQMVMNA